MKSKFRNTTAVSIILGSLVVVQAAHAQSAAPDGDQTAAVDAAESDNPLGDIVVTAQRKSESLQSVPVAVTAVSQEGLVKAGVTDSLDIAKLAPAMKIKTFGGRPNIFIRGVGLNDFGYNSVSPVAIYRDEAVVTSPGSQGFPLFDLDHIEVLRGPQGTLFGKSTTGGAILFNSKLPGNEFEGYVRADYGRYDLVQLETGMTLPVTDGLSVRLSGFTQQRDGDKINLYNDKHVGRQDRTGLRAIVSFKPEGGFEALAIAGYSRDRGDYLTAKPIGLLPGGVSAAGYKDPFPNDVRLLNYNSDAFKNIEDRYGILKLSYAAGDLTFRSITSYDKSDVHSQCDCDGSPDTLDEHHIGPVRASEFSQELQVAYNGTRLDGLFGIYYNRNKWSDDTAVNLFNGGLPGHWHIRANAKTYGVYGQGSYELLDNLKITAGARYTWDDYRGNSRADLVNNLGTPQETPFAVFLPLQYGQAKFDYFSWKLSADYSVTRDIMLYGSVSRGFKSGLFNFGINFNPAERQLVRPERLTSYEIGAKASLFDRRLRLNLAAFKYQYKDLQVVSVSPVAAGTAPFTLLRNAASADIKGFEVEATFAPIDTLSISNTMGILDAKYKSFPNAAIDPVTGNPVSYSGNRMPNAPKFTNITSISFDPHLTNSLDGVLYGEYTYVSKQYYNSGQDELVSSRKGYGIANFRVGVKAADDDWELVGWVRNAFNKKYIYESTDWSFEGQVGYYFGELRTYGLSFRKNF